MYLMNYKKRHVNTLYQTCVRYILGVYGANVDNANIINTVRLMVKMHIMGCRYDRGAVCREAFVQIFVYKVGLILLCRLCDNDFFSSFF